MEYRVELFGKCVSVVSGSLLGSLLTSERLPRRLTASCFDKCVDKKYGAHVCGGTSLPEHEAVR